MNTYLVEVRKGVLAAAACKARRITSVPVKESRSGKTVWEGEVEIFSLIGHPQARRCYAWGKMDDGKWKITTVFDIPPVDSAEAAVHVAV